MRSLKIGFIGYGPGLGQLLGEDFSSKHDIYFVDPGVDNPPVGTKLSTLEELTDSCEVIVLALHAKDFEKVVHEIKDLNLNGKLVVEILSTKSFSLGVMQENLPKDADLLSLHPLFGRPSFKIIEPGMRIVATHVHGKHANNFVRRLEEDHGLEIIHLTPEQHDRHMAVHHGNPFIIAHALAETSFNTDPNHLTIPSEEKLRTIVKIAERENRALYETIMRSNPYTKEAVDELIAALQAERDKLWPEN